MSDRDDGVAESLRRIEALIDALDSVPDPRAREPARALLELVLDLHGLALARAMAIVAGEGGALVARLAEDPHVRAVLLLHGLHPEETEARVRGAVESLRAPLAARGAAIVFVQVSASRARLHLLPADPAGCDSDTIRGEIETALVNAAPELEDIVIEGLDGVGVGSAAMVVG